MHVLLSICRRLERVELRVLATLLHQRLVRAVLGDARAFEHYYQVGHAHRAEAVRDEQRDAIAARGRGVALEERVLGLGVERRSGLVEHEQQRLLAHEATRERELLPLAEAHL